MEKHGQELLFDYTKNFLDVNGSEILDRRKPELIAVAKELISKRLGPEIGMAVAKQLAFKSLLSTTDHHAAIQHPFWVNANIISALPYLENQNPLLKYLIVLSFSSISVNNASGYARGLMLHQQEDSGNLARLPILSDKHKMATVYCALAFSRKNLVKAERQLSKQVAAKLISARRAEQVRGVMEKYFSTDDILDCELFKEQITKINFKMWPDFFHGATGGNIAGKYNPPGLIYLEIETLVAELLIRHHLFNKDSLLYKFLFNLEYQKLIPEIFNNIRGAFSLDKNWGTYLFWGVDAKQHRERMFLSVDGQLRSESGRHAYKFSPEGVKQALENKEIFPGMVFCYLVVSLYYGFKCLGGFCQVNDLTATKLAWQKLLGSVGEREEAEAVGPVQTKELGGDGMVLSYVKSAVGGIQPATGIDMILSSRSTLFDKYYEMSKQVTLAEMMGPMLPEIYAVLYNNKERDRLIMKLTAQDIVNESGIKNKL